MKRVYFIAVVFLMMLTVKLSGKTPENVVKTFWKYHSLGDIQAFNYVTPDCAFIDSNGKKKNVAHMRASFEFQNDFIAAVKKNDFAGAAAAFQKTLELSGGKLPKKISEYSDKEKSDFMKFSVRIVQNFPGKFAIEKSRNLKVLSMQEKDGKWRILTECAWRHVKAGKQEFFLERQNDRYIIKEIRSVK